MQEANSNSRRLDRARSNAVIDSLGGNAIVSDVCDVSSQAVSKWRRLGIPKARLMFLREKYKKLPIMKDAVVKNF